MPGGVSDPECGSGAGPPSCFERYGFQNFTPVI